jgi:hypothetical protein
VGWIGCVIGTVVSRGNVDKRIAHGQTRKQEKRAHRQEESNRRVIGHQEDRDVCGAAKSMLCMDLVLLECYKNAIRML